MKASRLAVRFGLLVAGVLAFRSEVQGQTIWVEAEKPRRASVSRHPWWYDQVKKNQLSGGDWISNWSDDKDGVVEYSVQVPAPGRYAFWVRANPEQTKLDYRIDKSRWTPIDMTADALDVANVAGDGKLDIRFLAWKKIGEADLQKGTLSIAFRMSSENHRHGAIDAFVLTTEPFVPSGTARPGKGAAATVQAGTWPFLTQRDAFRADAVLDLRGLNEKVAGESGFIRLAPDGESFVRGDGKPERFWAVTTYVQRDRSADELAHHARFLAKRGVNMVRLHGALEPKGKDPRLTDADPKTIDEAWKLVAAMKKEGIYTTLSPYWAASLKHIPASWGVDGWPENQDAQGLLFFNPRLQEGYRAWLKALLTPPNPYTGVPLAKDPALAIIQLQNEDSMLFWTMQSVKGRQLQLLGEQFGRWLTRKYGSLAAASTAWDGDAMTEDDFGRGVVGVHIVWEWTQARQGGRKKRLDDQLQFFAETMRRFNEETARYLRDELGCKQLVNAGNWKTADATLLNDVERWSYTANEVIAVNNYYSPVHIGPDRGWRINRGDRFENVSALVDPRSLPLNIKQVAGHPMMVTESHWVPPLGYQSEGPFLVAAMQSLTGVDAFYWFGTSEAEWSNVDRSDWDAASRQKWAIATPMVLGQFPAAALIYRMGYLKQGEPVVVEHRSAEQLWGRAVPVISEDPSYDPNRDKGDAARRSSATGSVDPLAFLTGPVKVVYDSDPARTKVADLASLIDGGNKVIRATTGEIGWDYGRGVCTINAPRAQGATGFLKTVSPIKLRDVTIESADDYATIIVAPLDGLPLNESRRVLVQVGTLARPTGWSDREAAFPADDGKQTIHGREILDTGKMPWAIKDADVTLRIVNPALASATRLDVNGNRGKILDVDVSGGALTLKLPKDAFYVVLEGR